MLSLVFGVFATNVVPSPQRNDRSASNVQSNVPNPTKSGLLLLLRHSFSASNFPSDMTSSTALPRFDTGIFRRVAALSLLTLFLSVVMAFDAKAQDVREVTFNEAVTIALENNTTIKRAENNLGLQELVVRAERASFLPNLNANTGANRNWGLQFDQTVGQLRNTSTDGFNYGLSTGINLFNGFADVASLNGARAQLEAQEYSMERTRQTVVFNVISNYLNVILAEENIRIRQEEVEAQQQLLDQIQEFVRVGSRAISDQYQQQATLANAESNLLNAESNFQLSKTRMIQVLQLDPLADYRFVAPDPSSLPLSVRSYNAEDLLVSAFERRADLRAQEASIKAAEQGIRAARSGYLPSLGLNASHGSGYTSANERDDFGTQLENNRSERLNLSLSIPLFNRLNVKRSIETSKVQYANARLDLENVQQNVAIEVRQAYLDYQIAAQRLDVTEKSLQAADQALQVEEERYEVGASTLVELQQSRSQYTNATSQRAQALFQFHFQHRLIEYYQGILDPGQSLFN
jgi:outer membrane protein